MRRRIFAFVLAVVILCSVGVLAACKKLDDENEVLSQRQQRFVDAVNAIETPITINSGAAIDAAYVAYGYLDEYERASSTIAQYKIILDAYDSQYNALSGGQGKDPVDEQAQLVANFVAAVNNLPSLDQLQLSDRKSIDSAYAIYNKLDADSKNKTEVIAAYTKLQDADARVAELEHQAQLDEWLMQADDFICRVYAIGEVTEESTYILEDLLYEYSKFPEEVLRIGGVKEAKALLDAKYEEYLVVRDKYDIERFVSAVNKIGRDGVTLNSAQAISSAENIYLYMSDNAKNDSSVVRAYEKLCGYRARYDELFAIAEQERIDYFIQLVEEMPTDVENMDMEWFFILDKISQAYYALSYESTSKPEVVDAFNRWNEVQKEFDKLGYKQIPMVDPILQFSGDSPPHIVLQYENNLFDAVKSFYNVTTLAQLAQQATAYLNVYVDGVKVASGALNTAGLGHIINNTEVVAILKQLAKSNSKIVSGANFSFTIHFEDNLQRYVHSYETNRSATKNNYTW